MSQRRRNTAHHSGTETTQQGQLDSYFSGTRGKAPEKSKMAPVNKTGKQHAPAQKQTTPAVLSPQPSPGSVSDSVPPTSPGSTVSRAGGSDIADLIEEGDIKKHIWSLPTREDLERFTARVEKAFTEDIAQLKEDTTHLGNRVETIEQRLDEALPTMSALQLRCAAQDQKLDLLLSQLDNFENRSRRANIRIRGMPEATAPRDIIPSLQGIFREILDLPDTEPIEIDRAHRALRPPSQDADNPRDIICKLHKYTLKERIMQKMRNRPYFDFDGAHLCFFQDISRRTLMQRRALKPVLLALQEAGLTYRWGFPFYLQAFKDGRSATLRTRDDLPHFLSALGLGKVDFPDWRGDHAMMNFPNIELPQPWTQMPQRRGRRRSRHQQESDASPGPSALRD